MGQQSAETKEISLGDTFGDVTVKANGTAVVIHANGAIEHYPILQGVRRQRSANDDEGKGRRPSEPKIGDKMLDGTVFAGISPDTGRAIYATPADAPVARGFNEASKYASTLDAHGHHDWRVPTKAELNVLFNNRAAIGGFDETGSLPTGWYISSSSSRVGRALTDRYVGSTWSQRFDDGYKDYPDFASELSISLRCVR
jgi:hypothetical protein